MIYTVTFNPAIDYVVRLDSPLQVAAINRAKPSGAKGTFIKKVSLSSTMGPGIKLDLATAIA